MTGNAIAGIGYVGIALLVAFPVLYFTWTRDDPEALNPVLMAFVIGFFWPVFLLVPFLALSGWMEGRQWESGKTMNKRRARADRLEVKAVRYETKGNIRRARQIRHAQAELRSGNRYIRT